MSVNDLLIEQVDNEITYLPMEHDFTVYFKQFNNNFRNEYRKRGHYSYNQLVMFNKKSANTKQEF